MSVCVFFICYVDNCVSIISVQKHLQEEPAAEDANYYSIIITKHINDDAVLLKIVHVTVMPQYNFMVQLRLYYFEYCVITI